jgi:diacylglycerol kinase
MPLLRRTSARAPSRPSARTWFRKFADAFRGLWRAVRTQSSFAVHLGMAGGVLVSGAFFGVSAVEWCLLVLAIGLVLMAEIVNTAIESLARAPGSRRHPRFRDALDMASAAVLVAAITAAVIGFVVFGPRLLAAVSR